MTNVDWCPYVQLLEGDVFVQADYDAGLYFIDDGHMGFKSYTYDEHKFKTDVLNGLIYKLDKTRETAASAITSVAMFQQMADSSNWKGVADGAYTPNITGVVYINNSDPVDEYTFRNGLAKKFPNLTFFFKNVTKAYTAKFIIQEKDGTYEYATYIENGNKALETIKEGWFANPYKTYKAEKDNWDFHGWSTTNDGMGLIGASNKTEAENDAAWAKAAEKFDANTYDYTFYAVFTIHAWEMTFYKAVGNTFKTTSVVHGEPIPTPSDIPALDESSLGATERYRFLGWSQNSTNLIVTSESAAKIVTLENIIASANMEFYAVFIKESVYDATSDLTWFNFKKISWTHPLDDDISIQGLRVSPKGDRVLSGKITLPTEVNGDYVISCGDFSGHNITHLFWKGPARLLSYEFQAFGSVESLKKVEMPKTLISIGESAFSACTSLELPDFANDTPALEYIGNYAYSGGGYSASGGITLNIPSSVKYLGCGSFSYMRKIGDRDHVFGQVNIGSEGSPSQLVEIRADLGENFETNIGRTQGNLTTYGLGDTLQTAISNRWAYFTTISHK